jgi:glycine cleavage system H protein
MSGKVASINDELSGSPDVINKDCYGNGWMIKIEPSDTSEWEQLLSPEAYEAEASKE